MSWKINYPYHHASRCIAQDTKYKRCFRCTDKFDGPHYCERHLNKSSKFNTKTYRQRNHAIGFNLYKIMMPRSIIDLIKSYDYHLNDSLIGVIQGYGSWKNYSESLGCRDLQEIRYNSTSSHRIYCVKIIPNNRLITGSCDDTMNHGLDSVIDIQYYKLLQRNDKIISYGIRVSDRISYGYGKNIKIWDASTFSCIQTIEFNNVNILFKGIIIDMDGIKWCFVRGSTAGNFQSSTQLYGSPGSQGNQGIQMMIYNFLPDQSSENDTDIKDNYIEQQIDTGHMDRIDNVYILSTDPNTHIVTSEWKEHKINIWIKRNSMFTCSHILNDDSKHPHATSIVIKNNTIYGYNHVDRKIKTWDLESGIVKWDHMETDMCIVWYSKPMIVLDSGHMVYEETLNDRSRRIVALIFDDDNKIVKYIIDINTTSCKDIKLLPDNRLIVCFDDPLIKIYDIDRFILDKMDSNLDNCNDLNPMSGIVCTFDQIHYKQIGPGYSPVDHTFIVNDCNHLISLRGTTIYIWK